MNTLHERITAIQRAFDGEGDPRTLIGELIEAEGERALRPLLTSFRFSEEMTDETYCIAHAVESFPTTIYLKELFAAAAELNKLNPDFLEFLVARVINSDVDFSEFLEMLASSPAQIAAVLREVLQHIQARYGQNAKIVRNSAKAIESLPRT
jgi:hypothetical protein